MGIFDSVELGCSIPITLLPVNDGASCCFPFKPHELYPLQLLGELLLDRHNFTIMTKYISKPENLKLMMNLLRDKSRNIQFEAFHVFKVQM